MPWRSLRIGSHHRGAVLAQFAAFVLAIAALVGWLAALGYPAGTVLQALWDGSVGAPGSLDVTLGHSVPLMLTAIAVWLAYQGGLFNVGPDGQLQLAGLVTVVVVTALPADWPGAVLIAAGIVAGVVSGALSAVIAVALKLWRGTSEVITTLMTTFIAISLINVLIAGPLRAPNALFTAESERIPPNAELGSVGASWLTWGLLLAAVSTVVVLIVVLRTGGGLRLRAVGLNSIAAQRAGIAVQRMQFISFAVGGALCGLAGSLVILGLRYELAPGWAPLWGFGGILIAFIARRSPVLIPVWALLFGMLTASGPVLKGAASVPDAIVTIAQTLPAVALFLIEAARRGWLRRRDAAAALDVPIASPAPTSGAVGGGVE